MVNSLRDEMKDSIRNIILDSPYYNAKELGDPIDLVCDIADTVLETLGISEDEQDLPADIMKNILSIRRS